MLKIVKLLFKGFVWYSWEVECDEEDILLLYTLILYIITSIW